MEIEPLPEELRTHRGLMRQYCRQRNVAMYQNLKTGAWDVIRIRVRTESTLSGHPLIAREYYPARQEWLTHAWTYPEEEWNAAMRRYKSMIALSERLGPAGADDPYGEYL